MRDNTTHEKRDRSDPLVSMVSELVERLIDKAADDEGLRTLLVGIASGILRQFEPTTVEPAKTQAATPDQPDSAAEPPRREAPIAKQALPELRFSSTVEQTPTIRSQVEQFATKHGPLDAELPEIAKRCRLKAEGARWAVRRQQLLQNGADYEAEIEPHDREIIARAKALPNCYLWMNHRSAPSPSDVSLFYMVADCFETVATALDLVEQTQKTVKENRERFEKSLDFLAEAQSALRVSVAPIDQQTDSDQEMVFAWLRRTAAEQQIFIQRHMRVDDPADPAAMEDLGERIAELEAEIETARQSDRHRGQLLKKAQYHMRRIDNGDGTDHDWNTILAVVDELVEIGVSPSNTELRGLLLEHVDDIPEHLEVPEGFHSVLREIDRFLATRPTPVVERIPEFSPEVIEVARLLAGKSVVLIGGSRRPLAKRNLQTSLGIEELFWISTNEHESIERFEPFVARDDVAVVLLAIRWSSHSYGDVQQYCEQYGKPLVRLPAGYSPNQVAYQILEQCGIRLGAKISSPRPEEATT